MRIANIDVPVSSAVNWGSNVIVGAAALFAALTYFGIGITMPFANAEEVKDLGKSVQTMQQQLQATNCVLLRISKRNAEDDFSKAAAELEKNPNSFSAQQAKQNALDSIDDAKQQLQAQGCRQP